MIINKILASYTFRFLWAYVIGLSVSVLIVLMLVYATYSYDYFKQLQGAVADEIVALEEVYENTGFGGLERFIGEKIEKGGLNRFYYLVVDQEKRKLAGNLDDWPIYRRYDDGWLEFHLEILSWNDQKRELRFIGRSEEIGDGYRMLVVHHHGEFRGYAEAIRGALVRSMMVTIVLGTIGGAIVAGLSVRQIDRTNKTLQSIMSGDLSDRIESASMRGEHKELALNINLMLDRIQQLMEGLRQVSDNIAHDLRTPLTRLRNQLSDMQDQAVSDREDRVQPLIDEADGLLSTFSSLLRIAQVESGSRRAGFTRLDLRIILLDVIELYEPLATDKAIRFVSSLQAEAFINGDRDLLFQAFANLIDNAVKYTPENGCVNVELGSAGEEAFVTVTDSGRGISAVDQGKVFERFYRVEASRSLHPGNGLGLSLVSAVVKLHYGHITLSNNQPGLRVEVRWPLVD
jgi:signal transduction histidine kinase